MANGTFLSGLLNCLFEDFFTSKNISSNLQKITCITLNLQYIDVQGDSMYSNLSIDATCFFNITLRLHIPGIMSNFIGCLSHNFTEMKKALCVIFVMLAGLVSCKYDDSEIWNKVNENEARIAALEEQCRGFNQDLQTLRTIVNALQGNDYVTGVVEVDRKSVV